ncbi:hypothetical protein [Jatrophihabitans sp.]|uniref:hypothetical protein n=1 Tax=Jatrophihabitans sp. TaxID=1932789 RepID=UPI002B9C9FCC|nr:hypothetical protein [Jatrophihabitans sp.]
MSAAVSALTRDLEFAHRQAVTAAGHGLQDAALGAARLTGAGVPVLAEAAVSSATPFLRAPLLSRIFNALRMHPVQGDAAGRCATCNVPAPCPTARELNP